MGGAESRISAKSKRLASWTDDRKLQQMGQDRTGLDSGRDWMGQAINLLIQSFWHEGMDDADMDGRICASQVKVPQTLQYRRTLGNLVPIL